MTAAQCVDNTETPGVTVFVKSSSGTVEKRTVVGITWNPEYRQNPFRDDTAVLDIDKTTPFSPDQIVPMATPDFWKKGMTGKGTFRIYGFGKEDSVEDPMIHQELFMNGVYKQYIDVPETQIQKTCPKAPRAFCFKHDTKINYGKKLTG